MACIGGAVALGSSVAPVRFLGLFGLPADQATGAAVLGWRLMAARTATLSALAARGNTTARDGFLPMQVLDQVAWWVGYLSRPGIAGGTEPIGGWSSASTEEVPGRAA